VVKTLCIREQLQDPKDSAKLLIEDELQEFGYRAVRCVYSAVPLAPRATDPQTAGPLKNSIAANIAKLPEFLPIPVDR
jgi:hypothetical protein